MIRFRRRCFVSLPNATALLLITSASRAWVHSCWRCKQLPVDLRFGGDYQQVKSPALTALSTAFLENDLVAVQKNGQPRPRLCAVKPDGGVVPLCIRLNALETDLFADPREYFDKFWEELCDENITIRIGEGFYGQRPVPSLGGGPGYGAQADEVWSVSYDILDEVKAQDIDLPTLDMGIAHGEKSRAGVF